MKEKGKFIVALFVCAFVANLAACGFLGFEKVETTGENGNPEYEWTLNVEKGQENLESAKEAAAGVSAAVSVASPSAGTTFSVVMNGVLALVSGILGIVGIVQKTKNAGLLETGKQTTAAAGEIIANEDIQKFVETVKEIQTENGVREAVRASLTAEENIANKI